MTVQLIQKAARDLVDSKYAIALTGAGISTESGIRDYRGPDGVWTKNPEAERRASRGYQEYMSDPKLWWESVLSGQMYSIFTGIGEVIPNSGHFALVDLEDMGILMYVITQNVDGLHETAGTRNLLEYHGSSLKLRCLSCGERYRTDDFDLHKLLKENKLPPVCPDCHGILKSDGVFFGEPIPSDVANRSVEEAIKCDLMLICGTSAVVYPFANLPRIARDNRMATIIEINAERTLLTEEGVSDYIIQGMTGVILPAIVDEVKRIKKSIQ